jgi:predicted dehydrogenase
VEKVRVGIIGIGNIGSDHAKSISSGAIEGMELAAIADINPVKLDWARENLPGGIKLFDDAEKMMASGLVDAIIIATPHYFHPPLAIKGFEHGLHVMSEKPAGVYLKQVKEMNEAAKKSDRVFAIMFNQRTNCIYRKMKEIVSSGGLGQIKRTNWIITNWYRSQSYYDSGNWRATWAGEGGGVLLNQCPHNLDLWQWICGMPSKVQAFCHIGKWHDIEVEDDVTAYVEYSNGATGVFITSTADSPGTNRFEILLNGGKLLCENDKLTLFKNKIPEREWNATYKGGFGEPGFETINVETDGQNPQHAGVLRAFAGAILYGKPLTASGLEGINGLTISNAMHLSSWLQKPVELPLDDDLFLSELNKRIATSRLKTSASGKVLSVNRSFGS